MSIEVLEVLLVQVLEYFLYLLFLHVVVDFVVAQEPNRPGRVGVQSEDRGVRVFDDACCPQVRAVAPYTQRYLLAMWW